MTMRLIATAASYGEDLTVATELARVLARPSNSLSVRAHGYAMAAELELARGHWRQARVELDQLSMLTPGPALVARALYAVSPFTPATTAELEELRGQVATLDAVVARDPYAADMLWAGLRPFLREYLLGILSVRLHDEARAMEHARALQARGGIPRMSTLDRPGVPERGGIIDMPTLGPDLAHAIRASNAWSAGDAATALRDLEQFPFRPQDLLAWLGVGAQGRERFLYAELLAAGGRYDEALRWFASFPEPEGYDLIYLAPSHLRRAEIHDKLGNRERAAFHYGRFVELWSDCDPEFRATVGSARARLNELRRQR
jgi:tetratricopeptide (TPR) repeat protein